MQRMKTLITWFLLLHVLSEYQCQEIVSERQITNNKYITIQVPINTRAGTKLYDLGSPNYKFEDSSSGLYVTIGRERGVVWSRRRLTSYTGERLVVVFLPTSSDNNITITITFIIVTDNPETTPSQSTVPPVPEIPRLTLDIPVPVENGTSVNFTCSATGFTDRPVFAWSPSRTRNGRIQISQTSRDPPWVSVLMFQPILKSDGEMVNCTARGNNIQVTRTATFTINVKTAIRVVGYSESSYVQAGDQVILNCTLQSGGAARLRWYRLDNPAEVIAEEEAVSWLATKALVTANSTFLCEGFDDTVSSRSNVVRVYVKDAIETSTYSTTTSMDASPIPELVLKAPLYIEDGRDAEFTCQATGFDEQPQFRWFPSPELSDRVHIKETSLESPWTSTLQFKPILQTDGEMVTCNAVGTVGKKVYNLSSYVSFVVNAKLQVLATPESVIIPSGALFNLTCSINQDGQFARLMWYLTGEREQPKSDSKVPVSSLIFTTSANSNSSFVCEAEAKGGRVRSNIVKIYVTSKDTGTSTTTSESTSSNTITITTSTPDTTSQTVDTETSGASTDSSSFVPSSSKFTTATSTSTSEATTMTSLYSTSYSTLKSTTPQSTPVSDTDVTTVSTTPSTTVTTSTIISSLSDNLTSSTTTTTDASSTSVSNITFPSSTTVSSTRESSTSPTTEGILSTTMSTTERTTPSVPTSGTTGTTTTTNVSPETSETTAVDYASTTSTTSVGTSASSTSTASTITQTTYADTSSSTDKTSDTPTFDTTENSSASQTATFELTSTTADGTTSNLTNTNSTTTVSYSATTPSSSAPSATTTVDGAIYCKEVTDVNGISWNKTLAGFSAVYPCPRGLPGISTRRCLDIGKWAIVKYDNLCRMSFLNSTSEKVSQIQEGTFTGSLGEVFQELSTVVDPDRMTPADMDNILGMMDKMTAQFNTLQVKNGDIKNLVDVAEKLLNVDSENWGVKDPKNLLTTLDEMAKQAITADSGSRIEQTFFTESIFFEIGSAKENNIDCPNLSGQVPEWVKDMNTSTRVMVESFPDMSGDERLWYSGVLYRSTDVLMERQYLKKINMRTPSEIREGMVDSSKALDKASVKNIVSGVISFNTSPRMKKLDPPVYITFETKRQDSTPFCSFIDYNETTGSVGNWSTAGCWVQSEEGSRVVCACNHTTNFAILMNPFTTEESEHEFILGIISIVGCGISLLFLLTTVIIYSMVWRYMVKTHVARVKAVLLINLCVTLIISYTLFLSGIRLTDNKFVCTAVAALLHYFFLAVFCVMLAEGIHLFISIVIVINFTSYLKSLFILIWVTPALIVGITIGIVKVDGYTGQRFCWLSTDGNVIWAFIAPALLIIFVNTIILFASVRRMLKRKDDKILKQGKYLARALAVILPIIGITWVFGVFAVNRDLVVFQYLFAICNSLQGAFIFIFHCCTSNVRAAFKDMRNRFNRQSISKSTLKSGSVYRTKSSQESYHSVNSNNSHYHLSLKTTSRNSSDPFEQQGNEIGRFISLPELFDSELEVPSQILLRADNSNDRVNRSPTSLQEFNLGFTDTGRRRVAFSTEYPSDYRFNDSTESSVDPESKRRGSISFFPVATVLETETEHVRRRKREIQHYEICNAFAEMRKSRFEESAARERWQAAYDAISHARKFKVSPKTSANQESSSTSPEDTDRYIMMRL